MVIINDRFNQRVTVDSADSHIPSNLTGLVYAWSFLPRCRNTDG